jgi:carbon monoxide dehydrogenase subunit G
MTLTEISGGSTKLGWTAEVTVTGTIASLAARMLPGVTQKLSAEFFDCVRSSVQG